MDERSSPMNENITNNNHQPDTSMNIDLDLLSPIMIRHQLQGTKSTFASVDLQPGHDIESNNLTTSFNSPIPNSHNSPASHKKRNKSPMIIANNKYPPSPSLTPRKNVMGPPTKNSPIIQNQFSESGNLFDSSGYDTSTSSGRSLQSPLSVQAILGPFSSIEEAKTVQQEWRKPAKSDLKRLKDPEKGLQKEGRCLARKYNSSMMEYWDFLETYCDLTSSHGLKQLDIYLHEKMECRICLTPKLDKNHEGNSFVEGTIWSTQNEIQKQSKIEQGDQYIASTRINLGRFLESDPWTFILSF